MYVMRPCPQLEHLRSTYTHTYSGCHVLAVPWFSVATYTNPLLDMFGQPPLQLYTGTCKHHTEHGLAFSSNTTLPTHPSTAPLTQVMSNSMPASSLPLYTFRAHNHYPINLPLPVHKPKSLNATCLTKHTPPLHCHVPLCITPTQSSTLSCATLYNPYPVLYTVMCHSV